MNKKKMAALLAAALAATICLTGCQDKPADNPASSTPPSETAGSELTGNGSTGLTPNPVPEDEQVTPEDMDQYISDMAQLLTEDQRSILNTYTTNWYNLYGERVCLSIVPALDAETSIDKVGANLREELELGNKDSVLAVSADTGDSMLLIGEDSVLVSAGVMPNLEPGVSVTEGILNKYEEINDYLMGGSGEMPEGPSEEDIATGEAIFDKTGKVLSEYGLELYDISTVLSNQEQYPDSVIMETGDGHITFQVLSGSVEDCDIYWFWYYNMITGENAARGEDGVMTFVQKFDPSNLYRHKSISGTVNVPLDDGTTDTSYYRADCIGKVCVAVKADSNSYQEQIDTMFEEFGFPENNNIVF